MKYLYPIAFLLLFLTCKKQELSEYTPAGDLLASVAFGSCNKQNEEQVLWDDVLADEPDVWIWLGDNIYGDTSDPELMRSKYTMQKENELYKELRSKVEVYGIWDDHDYGKNDGGKEFHAKDTMRDLMFEFLDLPQSQSAWRREGGYQSYELEIRGFKIKIILLDSRYFRDSVIKEKGGYLPNLEGSILGEAQWNWLEDQVANLDADLLIVGNGIQVIPEEHRFEKWANFPNERKRLLNLLDGQNKLPTLLLSGDRHLTEVSKIEDENVLYEVTSSGMTHSYSNFTSEKNKHRIGEVVSEKSYGLLKIYQGVEGTELIVEARGDGGKTYLRIPLAY